MIRILGIEVKEDFIPGTNIHKPRDRKEGETEDQYVNNYLIGQYYSKFFPQSVENFKKESESFIDEEIRTEGIHRIPLFQSLSTDEEKMNVKAEDRVRMEATASKELRKKVRRERKNIFLNYNDLLGVHGLPNVRPIFKIENLMIDSNSTMFSTTWEENSIHNK